MKRLGLYRKVPKKVWHQSWIVHSKSVGDGRQSLRYLAPYVFRVAIGNHRIKQVTKHENGTCKVVFMVRPSGSRRYRPCEVSVEEFIRRFLQHVLPTGLQKVRHYGFMHPRSKVAPTWLKMLVTLSINLVYVIDVGASQHEPKRKAQCTDCGGELQFLGVESTKPQLSNIFNSN